MMVNEVVAPPTPNLPEALEKFLPIAMEEIGIDKLPRIKLLKRVPDEDQPTFGRYENQKNIIYLGIQNRHILDIFRTLAHELVHFKQNLDGVLTPQSGDTGSPHENEAHEIAGIIMRKFNKLYPNFFNEPSITIKENFADGRNPQDKGDSKRHNVPTKGKISTLRKIAKQGGRRGQLAHWMANMRSGRKK